MPTSAVSFYAKACLLCAGLSMSACLLPSERNWDVPLLDCPHGTPMWLPGGVAVIGKRLHSAAALRICAFA